jgi:ATP-dependent phosphofructokinase / diphosphate-dependent phosphofructokinase
MTTKFKRIGVLTGGGDCPGLNAVIRAVVKTAHNEYGWEVLGIADGFEGLILPGKIRPLSFADVRGILPRGGTILGSTNRANPFDYKVVENGNVISKDMSDQVLEHAREAGMDALVVIGGDGTLHIAYELMQKGLKVVGVPKTIDNDIKGTAISFGFDTALNTAMEALDRLHTTAESHHRIIILEVMGRDAGWIALKAGIAGGADIILIPEIPYELKEIISKIEAREDRGAKFSIIVVAEGALPVGGEAVYQSHREIGGVRRLGGIGETLAEQLRDFTHKEVRTTVLGYLQRGGSPTAFDRLLSSRYGAHAVHMIAQGLWGHMVAVRNDEIGPVPLSEVVTGQKFVPLDSDAIMTAFGLGLCLGNSRAFIEDMISDG